MRNGVETYPNMLPTLDSKSLESGGLLVVDFTAAWCGPCKTLLPILEALATEYKNHARFATVDVDHDPAMAQRFDVRSMPTLVLLRDGREVGRVVGARPRAQLQAVLDRALAG
jgi:thioredoxin 1